jgi:hypothetical protein
MVPKRCHADGVATLIYAATSSIPRRARYREPQPLALRTAPVAAGERRWLQGRKPRAGRAMLGA